MDVNPYKLFGLTKDFTIDELKVKFKQLAMVSHPDKGGSEQLFLLITQCFKKLMEDHNRRVSDRSHHELKATYDTDRRQQQQPPPPVNGRKFDIEKFNKVFGDNRMKTHEDHGYGDWIQSDDGVTASPQKIIPKESFNRVFEETVKPKNVVVYTEPEPLLLSKKIQYTELGVDRVNDFSGDNTTQRKLNFMDYKIAHTTTRIVDPTQVSRKEYRNIGELKVDRENVQYNMSDKDMADYVKKKQEAELAEKRRQKIQMQQDVLAFNQFDKMQRMMLEHRG
jgi:curved DNA-binding protein CbpA